jgi:hypothetical protein
LYEKTDNIFTVEENIYFFLRAVLCAVNINPQAPNVRRVKFIHRELRKYPPENVA